MSLPSSRLLTKSQAAAYCGLSPATFGGTCPVRPISLGHGVRMQRYDVQDIDKWIDSVKATPERGNSLAMLLLNRPDRPSNLDDKHLKVLRYMRDHPECNTSTDIQGAGERTLDILTGKDAISHVGDDEKGSRRFALTKTGLDELKSMDDWERSKK